MSEYVAPPGWPGEVRPPGAPDWESSAHRWLLDLCPPEYRLHEQLRRHLVVLARFAVLHVEGGVVAVRRGIAETRTTFAGLLDEPGIDAVVLTWQAEEARLLGLRRSARLVEEAARGRRFRARL